jgi:hypothetical protein
MIEFENKIKIRFKNIQKGRKLNEKEINKD